jgi:hypothetical protein
MPNLPVVLLDALVASRERLAERVVLVLRRAGAASNSAVIEEAVAAVVLHHLVDGLAVVRRVDLRHHHLDDVRVLARLWRVVLSENSLGGDCGD